MVQGNYYCYACLVVLSENYSIDISFISDLSNADGLGYILLINHMPMLYAPERYLGDRLATYGLTFSVFLRISNTGALNVNTTIIR